MENEKNEETSSEPTPLNDDAAESDEMNVSSENTTAESKESSYADDENKEKAKKNKRLFIIIASLAAILLVGFGVFFALNATPKADQDFLATLEQSVTYRMENSDDDATDYSEWEPLVNSELAYLEEFRDAEFSDPIIAEAASQYLEGLDKQKAAVNDAEYVSEQQLLWNEGIVLRYGALNTLYEKYDFMSENKQFVADYIIGYEDSKKLYDAISAIEADITAQREANQIEFSYLDNSCSVTATLMNNTDYSFESVWEFEALAEDGTVLYTSTTIASANPHAKYVATGSFPYDIYQQIDTFNWNNWYSDISY